MSEWKWKEVMRDIMQIVESVIEWSSNILSLLYAMIHSMEGFGWIMKELLK